MIGSPLCKFSSICTSTLLNGQMEVVNERPIFIYNVYLSLFIPAIMDSKFQLSRALCKQDDIYRWTSYLLRVISSYTWWQYQFITHSLG